MSLSRVKTHQDITSKTQYKSEIGFFVVGISFILPSEQHKKTGKTGRHIIIVVCNINGNIFGIITTVIPALIKIIYFKSKVQDSKEIKNTFY